MEVFTITTISIIPCGHMKPNLLVFIISMFNLVKTNEIIGSVPVYFNLVASDRRFRLDQGNI